MHVNVQSAQYTCDWVVSAGNPLSPVGVQPPAEKPIIQVHVPPSGDVKNSNITLADCVGPCGAIVGIGTTGASGAANAGITPSDTAHPLGMRTADDVFQRLDAGGKLSG